MQRDTHTIIYKGNTLETIYSCNLSDEDHARLKREYYSKPNKCLVVKQMLNIKHGGCRVNYITRYYFRNLMSQVQHLRAKWTVQDVFDCKELLEVFVAKTIENKKVFPDTKSQINNVETAIRLAGAGIAKLPTQFPFKMADYIITKYNTNNNVYDFSCGWGMRLLACLKHNINYFGTDPNYELVHQLKNLYADYKESVDCNSSADIQCSGSETFNPMWENTIGLAFSSPPYFNLEDYKIGKQSYDKNTTYDQWLNNYMCPTLVNIYQYLIPGGILAINIKNIPNYMLEDDVNDMILKIGYDKIGCERLNQTKRTCPNIKFNYTTDENIFIYQKPKEQI